MSLNFTKFLGLALQTYAQLVPQTLYTKAYLVLTFRKLFWHRKIKWKSSFSSETMFPRKMIQNDYVKLTLTCFYNIAWLFVNKTTCKQAPPCALYWPGKRLHRISIMSVFFLNKSRDHFIKILWRSMSSWNTFTIFNDSVPKHCKCLTIVESKTKKVKST